MTPFPVPRVTPLLEPQEAADLLRVPKSWIMAEARAQRVPHVRLGRYVRFEQDMLDAWWQKRRHGPWRTSGAAAETARDGDPSGAEGSSGVTALADDDPGA